MSHIKRTSKEHKSVMIKKGRVANFTELIRGHTANFESLPDCLFFFHFFFPVSGRPSC